METLVCEIDKNVATAFPDLIVGGFLVSNLTEAARRIDTGPLMEKAQQELLSQGITVANLVDDPRIAGWRAAFKQMGLKPSTYKGSAEQLGRRLLKGEQIKTPLPAVNLYCAVSAHYLAPIGAYDLARLPEQHVVVRFARPDIDVFAPLGGRSEDMPISPEIVVYGCDREIICWAFNHRDSKNTCLTENTETAAFFSEGVSSEHKGPLIASLETIRGLLAKNGAIVGQLCVLSSETTQATLHLPAVTLR